MTCSAYTVAEMQERIDLLKTIVRAYDDAILALASGAQMYSLDTGQTRQMVQRSQLSQLRLARQSLQNELRMAVRELCGGGTIIARPGF